MKIRKDGFDYKSVPRYFAHCFNDQCPKTNDCLRRLAAINNTPDKSFITIVNPACFPSNGHTCPHFKPQSKSHMAWGITHLLDNVPHKDATELRNEMINHFNKSLYYRFYRKEHALSPDDQRYILQLFKEKGITEEPVYDYYTDEYNW